jgi:hypothetical protein
LTHDIGTRSGARCDRDWSCDCLRRPARRRCYVLQAWLAIQEKGDALGDYRAASYLRAEVGFWHPIRRWRREREVRRLLRADPALHRQVRRIGIELWSWEALCLAAALVASDTFIR